MEHRHVLMGKSTISMAMFNSKLLVYQTLQHQDPTLAHFRPSTTWQAGPGWCHGGTEGYPRGLDLGMVLLFLNVLNQFNTYTYIHTMYVSLFCYSC